MPTAVVCEDDPVLRSTISALCEDAQLDVVAETDSGGDAVMMVRRFGVDVLVLDLALWDGSGEETLRVLQDEGLRPSVVVFTAYAVDARRLLALGAREVVEKPDLDALAVVLTRLGTPPSTDEERGQEERRVASRAVEDLPVWRSPSGIASARDLARTYRSLDAGDAVLALRVLGLDALEADIGPLLVHDCRLAIAARLRTVLRVQDLLHEAPMGDGFVALLRGGNARSADAVWARLTSLVRDDGLAGELHGAGALVGEAGGAEAVARATSALHGVVVGSPAFTNV